MGEVALDVRNLTVRFGENILIENFSIELLYGKMYCLVGKNGVGKTSLLKTFIGSIPTGKGEIFFDGQEITPFNIHQRSNLGMGYLPQNENIFPRLSIDDHFKLLKLNPLTIFPESINQRLKKFLLSNKEEQAGNLSFGQRQLLAIVIISIQKNTLLLLDEPFAGVDLKVREIIVDILRFLSNQRNVCILIIEQDQNLISTFKGELIEIMKN